MPQQLERVMMLSAIVGELPVILMLPTGGELEPGA